MFVGGGRMSLLWMRPPPFSLGASMKAKQVQEAIETRKKRRETPPDGSHLLSTGSTLLNLNLSGDWRGGLVKGKYFFFVGDTSSGKTFFTCTCFAEAAINPAFDNYRFIHDNVEIGALMNFEKFFGKAAASRIEPPAKNEDGTPKYSTTDDEFYFHVDDAFNVGQPFIYVLDSMDALTSRAEIKKFMEHKRANRKNTEAAGDFGDGKAKRNSRGLRTLLHRLDNTGSILIIINQTRDNVNAGLFAPKKTRSGGRALSFYATAEMWTSVSGKIVKAVRGKERKIGITSRIEIKKNRITGRDRSCTIPIKYAYGIDDIDSCIDYLIQEGHWKKTGYKINTRGQFDCDSTVNKSTLIQKIEAGGYEEELRKQVAIVWNEIEEACVEERKSRY